MTDLEVENQFNNTCLILVVEDDPDIQDILCEYLERAGFRTFSVADGPAALVQNEALKPDLILLDIRLPKMDGKDVLLKIRAKSTTPIIMVTAIIDDVEKLQTLKNGADDYIIKPFNPNEVVERVKAVLRRTIAPIDAQRVVRVDNLEIDADTHLVCIADAKGEKQTLSLTPTEFCLLEKMSRSPYKVFSREELIEVCITDSDAFDRVVDSHLSNLRRKMKVDGQQKFVESVRGFGYRLCQVK